MSNIKIAIWSAIIEPGKEYMMSVPRDFTLTNAALAENLADPTGRSVVKLTHEVIPASRFGQAADEDEEEDEEEEEGDVQMQTVVVTSLTAGKNEQSLLNLTFVEDEEIVFTVSGSNVVHLSGNYIDQDPSDGEPGSDEDDFDSEDAEDWSDEEDMMDEDDEEEEVSAKITEIPASNGKRTAAVAGIEDAAAAVADLSKSQKKKLNKKLKGESGEAAPAPAAAAAPVAPVKAVEKKPEEKKTSNKKTLASGLIIEDSKLGTGAVAKAGKKVGMRYIGKLANGKVFDSNTNGKPFVFKLGVGEVIKGWDQGVAGMAIGGERKLVIPAPLAYGSKALPGIPKNSTLHFEVKLVSVN